jgi:dihydroflavonol-4-reductase
MATFEGAFVTGSTGLLGNNLVRLLVERGHRVKALARSRRKAAEQFAGLDVEVVEGDMTNVPAFQEALRGIDVLFHTAAYFRDSYKGGRHWEELYQVNVEGTEALLSAAYEAGVRRMVHTSTSGVLDGPPGGLIDETMRRSESDANDYFRSKILTDRRIDAFLEGHADFDATFVLPGFMFGPGDIGPTSSGQLVLDFARKKLPGIVPGSFSVVDARDVAACSIAAAERGRRGERYLCAGRHKTMAEILATIERASGVKAPSLRLPMWLLFAIATGYEAYARITGRPVLISLASVRLLARENERSRFDHAKTERELGVSFRPFEETLADEITWYRDHGDLPPLSGVATGPPAREPAASGASRPETRSAETVDEMEIP